MTERIYSSRLGERFVYPSWKALLNALPHTKEGKNIGLSAAQDVIDEVLETLTAIHENKAGFSPELVQQIVSRARANYHKGMPIEEVKESMDRFQFGTNEFHTIYDIQKVKYTYVSDRVETILGIPRDKFTIERMYAMLPEGGLHHPEDVHHILRWGNLAYTVLGIPGFHFRANDDHYLVRHRISTAPSDREDIRALQYIMVEKRCYLCHEGDDNGDLHPSMHLDRWTVLDNVTHHFVRPHFVTSPDQSTLMNGMLYLLNALLIGVPVKYIMLLNERMESDRNKAIANSVSEKMSHYAGLTSEMDDKSVADCFAKTIRARLREAMRIWVPSEKPHSVETDVEALKAAMKLGLVPIPPLVEQLIYSSVTEM